MNNFSIKIIILLLVISSGLFVVEKAFSGVPSDFNFGDVASGIANTPHNLSSTGTFVSNDETDICIFCHTPHHGGTELPLWNRQSTAASFNAYGTTLAGTYVADSDVGPASLACLSCHDGITSFDTLVNAPGKGGGVPVDMNWVFTVDGNTVSDVLTSKTSIIGTDLKNDHPVSVPYKENVASLRAKTTVISSIEMTAGTLTASLGSDASSRTATSNRWSVKGFISEDATIEDLLRDGKVECVSCHDPHFKNTSWDEVDSTWGEPGEVTGLFLRRVGGNSVSGVCRTCHNK